MIRQVLESLETGALGTIGLVAFVVAFVLILIRVLTMSKKFREEAKRIPLDDEPGIAPNEDGHKQ